MSKFGNQPGLAVLHQQGWSINRAADELGESRGHLFTSLRGRCSPCQRLRESLPKLTGLPIEALFTSESLADRYRMGPGNEPRPRVGQSPEARAKIGAATRRYWEKKRAEAQR